MSAMSLSFKEWPFPSKKKQSHFSAWGQCGLFACTFGSNVTVFSNENGRFSPMYMFSPIEHHDVTAIGWSNGSSYPVLVQPILAIALDNGKILVYNFRTKEIIGKNHFSEYVNVIKWSAFDSNRLYIGTKNGHLYSCTIRNKIVEVSRDYEFNSEIDFIAEDCVDGSTIAVAGKNGFIGCIKNIHKSRIHVHNFFINEKINFFEFYPNHPNFLITTTRKGIHLFSIHESTIVSFIDTHDAKFVSVPNSSSSQVIIGYDDSIALWGLENGAWKRISLTNFVSLKNQSAEILTYSILDDQILVTNSSHWLSMIELHRNKLFITKRIKLMDSKPKDWSFRKGSIAFALSNGSVSITSWTPDSIIKPIFCEAKEIPSFDNLSSIYYSRLSLNDWNDLESENNELPINDEDYGEQPESSSFSDAFVSVPYSHLPRSKSSVGIDDCNIALQQMLKEKINKKVSYATGTKTKSTNYKKEKSTPTQALCGNSNTILLNMKISDSPLKGIRWAPGGRIFTWNQKHLYLIDMKTRKISEPLRSKLEGNDSLISQVFFTKSSESLCVVIDGKTAIFLTTGSRPKIIGSLSFGKTKVFGSFSPKEDQVIFASSKNLYVSKFNQSSVDYDSKYKYNDIYGKATFLSWKKCGIIIGTENGNAFITNLECSDYKNVIKLENPINFVAPCANKSFVVVDSFGNMNVISNGVSHSFKDKVKNIDLANRDTFVVKFSGESKLTTLSSYGHFSPLPPPCLSRCPLMLDQQRYKRELNNLKITSFSQAYNSSRLFGSTFIQQLLVSKENPIIIRNNIGLLYKILSDHASFRVWAFRIALKIGELNEARNHLLNTDPTSKDFISRMSLAALFDTKIPGESINLVINNLYENQKYVDATDIVLITKGPKAAVEELIKYKRYRDAYLILMLQKENERDEELVHKVSNGLIEDDAILPSLKLLSASGYKKEMIEKASKIVGPDLSQILDWLD